jgi:hypothetical protein
MMRRSYGVFFIFFFSHFSSLLSLLVSLLVLGGGGSGYLGTCTTFGSASSTQALLTTDPNYPGANIGQGGFNGNTALSGYAGMPPSTTININKKPLMDHELHSLVHYTVSANTRIRIYTAYFRSLESAIASAIEKAIAPAVKSTLRATIISASTSAIAAAIREAQCTAVTATIKTAQCTAVTAAI